MNLKIENILKIKIQLLSALALCLCLSIAANAQSQIKIHGYVTDKESGLPLAGANILIEGTGLGTTSNSEGYFFFENLLADTYELSASYIGYNKKSVENVKVGMGFSTEVDFKLAPKEYSLDLITISATESNNTSSGNVFVFDREKIEKKQSQSVGELIEDLPGIEIESSGAVGSSQKISIRGSQANHVLILLDGVPLNNQSGGEADLSNIPVNIIERIEVHEGGSSSKFGNGAVAGALNIITRNKFSKEIKLNTSIGSFGLKQIEPVFSGSYNDFNYYLSFNYLESDGSFKYFYIDNAGNEKTDTRLNSAAENRSLFAKANYSFTNSVLTLTFQNFNNDRGIPGKIYGLSPFAKSENSNNIAAVNYFWQAGNFNITSDLKYSGSETINKNLFPDDTELKYKKIPKYHYKYKTENILFSLNSNYKYSDWLSFSAGYSFKNLDYTDKNYLPSIYAQRSSAEDISNSVFIHSELKKQFAWMNSLLVLTPALRFDDIRLNGKEASRDEKQWSPGASLYFSIGSVNKLFIKGNISRSFRVPTFADLFYQDVRVEGKTDLLPEKGINRDVSFGFDAEIFGRLSSAVTIYHNKIDDLIIWRLGSFEVFRPFNTNAELKGTDYSASYTLPKEWFTISYSYSDLEPLNKNPNLTTYNKILPYKPVNSQKLKAEFSYKNFNSSLSYKLVGKRFVTEANTVCMEPYEVLNFYMSFLTELNGLKVKFKTSVLNLLNEKYEIIKDYPLPQREWRFGISITY